MKDKSDQESQFKGSRKERVNIMLSQDEIYSLDQTALYLSQLYKRSVSRSEVIQRFAKGQIAQELETLRGVLEGIPREPQRWDKATKSTIKYELEKAVNLLQEIKNTLPQAHNPDDSSV
jgi:hypothetical protein